VAVLLQEKMDRGREGGYRDQTDPWLRLGNRGGPARYGEGRDWCGEEERRALLIFVNAHRKGPASTRISVSISPGIYF
jgi:hypothetical protein